MTPSTHQDGAAGDDGINKQFLAAPIKRAVDKFQLVPEFLKVRGLVREHLESYNYFVTKGMQEVVRVNNRVVSRSNPDLYLEYKDVRIGEPVLFMDFNAHKLTPHMCRLTDMTYAAPIHVDIEYVKKINSSMHIEHKKNVVIGSMPVMLRSSCCVLYGKDESELARLGECPLDPGGYFVVKGSEKVILIQEQLSNNRIIIDHDKKRNLIAYVTSSTARIRSKTIIFLEKEKIYLQLKLFQSKIPIMVLMKAMGMESDQEVVQMVGRDPRYSALLLPSIEECASSTVNVITQQEALDYLETKLKKPQCFSASAEQENNAFGILCEIFLAHVPVWENSLRQKCIYTAVMLRRMLDAFLNKEAVDDKDYVGNKRFELSGQLMSMLFEDLFKTFNSSIRTRVDKVLEKRCRSSSFDFSMHICADEITAGLERALSTGNWCIKRFGVDKKGVSQVLGRLSFMGSMGYMTKISPQFEKSRKVSGPRALQPSQWGMLCPCDTPEGEACGLVKNLALMTHVTTDEYEARRLTSLCFTLGVEDLENLSGEELHSPDSFLVIFNGLILGKHTRPEQFASALRRLRRADKIGEFVSVFVNEKQSCVYVAFDGGRECRPLVIADKGVSRIKLHHMRELLDGARTFDDFLRDGLIEYLDLMRKTMPWLWVRMLADHESGRTENEGCGNEDAKVDVWTYAVG